MRIVDLESRREIIGDNDAAELRLRLGDFQDHREPRVLLHRLCIDRIAGEREGLALDLESLLGRGLRRERRAGHGDDAVDRGIAIVGDAQRRRQIGGADGAGQRALPRSPLTSRARPPPSLASARAASRSHASSCVDR